LAKSGLDAPNFLFSGGAPMPQPRKPPILRSGDGIRVLSLASPVQEERLRAGCAELARLGYTPLVDWPSTLAHNSFFAGSAENRVAALKQAFAESAARAIFCSRGGYGSNYLVDGLSLAPGPAKILLGASDLTSLQIFLWQRFRWVTFYGPMVASNFDRGESAPHGYERCSLMRALTGATEGWTIDLQAKPLARGAAEGVLLGGCLTLVEASLGTPWELDTEGAVLVLEDRAMKPYQIDRALMHLKHAGKFRGIAGILLGDFPECEGPADGETAEEVARRILSPLGVPVVWGAPVGHSVRPALTLPLGIAARLVADDQTQLQVLEPACTP
jgi:muramoyltetrapeptide carboxypeptidase